MLTKPSTRSCLDLVCPIRIFTYCFFQTHFNIILFISRSHCFLLDVVDCKPGVGEDCILLGHNEVATGKELSEYLPNDRRNVVEDLKFKVTLLSEF